jgi:hypothetical protein
VRDRVPITCGNLRICRVAIHLSASTRRENCRIGDDLDRLPRHCRADSVALASTHDEIEYASFFENCYRLRFPNPLYQCSRYFRTGLVSMCVNNSPSRMCRFLAELELTARGKIEVGAGSVKLAHAGGTFLDQDLDSCRITERRSGSKGVPPVQFRRISRSQSRGYAALRVRRSAIEQ